MRQVHRDLVGVCEARGQKPPSRATLYNLMRTLPGHCYRICDLPEGVQRALYNLDSGGEVPGAQLVLYCINYGGMAEVSFAAGLPWLDLYRATLMRGFRPKSRGLLDAIVRARHI